MLNTLVYKQQFFMWCPFFVRYYSNILQKKSTNLSAQITHQFLRNVSKYPILGRSSKIRDFLCLIGKNVR